MGPLPEQIEMNGVPPYVAAWSVAKIPGFVGAVFKRWQHERVELPHEFFLVMCPQVEINARGGLPPGVLAMTGPKLHCRHFTGCLRPYFVAIFAGEDAKERLARVQELLSWSEGYRVEITDQKIRLDFVHATEDLEEPAYTPAPQRSLQELLSTGELFKILD
jgi:hypothetical protein